MYWPGEPRAASVVRRRRSPALPGGSRSRPGARVSCSFDLAHYRELLGAAKAGGYRFARFGEDPDEGDLFLRHDVDLSLAAAVEMAELEAELEVQATYLLM